MRGSAPLPVRDTGHPILLIHAKKSSGQEAENDRIWREVVESTFGGCDVWSTARLRSSAARDSLSRRLVVVFTHAALTELDTLEIARVQEYVKGGGVALLDTPPKPWAKVAGVEVRFVREREELPWPQALSWRTGSSNPPSWQPGKSGAGALPSDLPPAALHFTQLGFRPASYGLRSVGNPFGMSSIWWTSRGTGGWLTESLCLPCLLRSLEHESSLTKERRAQWREAIVHALLSPDIFPLPFPRVWAEPFSPLGSVDRQEDWQALRGKIHLSPSWHAPRTLELKVVVPASDFSAAVAVPLRWRGRSLSSWSSSWEKARTRSVEHGGAGWRLLSVPAGESTLSLRYSPTRW